MTVTANNLHDHLKISLAGELDHHSAAAAMRQITAIIEKSRARRCSIDLSELTFMDSSGIAVLISAYNSLREVDGVLTISQMSGQAQKIILAAGLERLINIPVLGVKK